MKLVCLHHGPRAKSLVTGLFLLATMSAYAQIHTNWAAYNDHRPSAAPVANGWAKTGTNVTGFDMGAPADTSGTLINFFDGHPLPVTVTFTRTGAPNDFGTVTRPLPTNTPAAAIFYGICDLSNDGIVGLDTTATATNSLLITFSGLNPSKGYLFRGAGGRNGGYAPRWSVATINADGWIDAHLNGSGPGVITSNDFPANLGAGQAAWNSGHNAQGAVVGWDFITPHPDGTFTINMEQYIGPTPGGGTALIDNYGYSFGALLLAEVEVAAATITTNPPAQVNVLQNRPFTLTVSATGTPLLYQWYKQGSGAIAGAHFASYSVAQAATGDAGDYFVVVSNPLGNRTSTLSHVTVTLDTAAPVVSTALAFPTVQPAGDVALLDQVVVEFDEPVQAASVSSPANYTLTGGVHPLSVIVSNAQAVVLQLGTPLNPDTDYTVTTSGARDVLGNTAGSSTTSFHTWVPGIGNGLLFEAFDAGSGVELDTLLNSPNYPDHPFLRTNLPIFDTRFIFPNNDNGAYGARISGVFIPPVSGNYLFFMRTFDRGAVYLNPNGLDPAGKQEILRESTGNNPRNWDKFASSLFPLRAGQGYYIEALYKADAGTAADVMKVAARLQGTGVPTPVDAADTLVDPNSIFGGFIGFPLAPRNLGGTLTIVQDLVDQTADELNPTTFTIRVSNPSQLPLQYQWFKNGTPILGANGPSYSLQPTVADDNGAKFSVQAAKVGAVVTSRQATLTVVPDVHPPRLLSVSSNPTNLNAIQVHFNEIINSGEANDLFNYGLVGSGVDVNLASAALEADGQTVTLTTLDALTLGASYTLSVGNVSDLASLTINPNPSLITFTFGPSDLPRLTISLSGNSVTISWPDPSTGFVLEQTSQLVSPPGTTVWAPVNAQETVANGKKSVTLTLDTGTKLYRLHQ